MELSAVEFIRRFVQHILPNNFYKIRYYGLFACINRTSKLMICFDRLKAAMSISKFEGLIWHEIIEILLSKMAVPAIMGELCFKQNSDYPFSLKTLHYLNIFLSLLTFLRIFEFRIKH